MASAVLLCGTQPFVFVLACKCHTPHPFVAGNWGKEGAGGGVELPGTVPAGLEYFNPGAAALGRLGSGLLLAAASHRRNCHA